MELRKGIAISTLLFVSGIAGAQTSSGALRAQPAVPLIVTRAEPVNGSALPSGTDVWLSFDQAVDSRIVRQGDILPMRVSRDVTLGNYIVIPRGASARGMVSYRTGKGAFGKSGKLEFDLTDVKLASRNIALSGHYRIEGNGNTGATIGAAIAVGVFSAFVKGHSAVVPQGSEWKGATKEAIPISLQDEPAKPAGGVVITKSN